MSAPGRQSPKPEDQSSAQGKDPIAGGHGVNEDSQSKKNSSNTLEGLSSNPKGPLDDHVADTAKKTVGNNKGDVKF
ncbi:hypothetical protein B0O99DRAFT_683484 [Bisporella sp. PMI_857]|nr:hypothetical protein B0O99DRAFT_683484 [Bisporella sp. PMI_857]